MILSITQLSICWVVSFAGWYLYEHDLAWQGATRESSSLWRIIRTLFLLARRRVQEIAAFDGNIQSSSKVPPDEIGTVVHIIQRDRGI
jgi:hypothetical protein